MISLMFQDVFDILCSTLAYDDVLDYSFIKLKFKIFGLYFWDITSWYRSLGLRDSGTLSGVPELKLRVVNFS